MSIMSIETRAVLDVDAADSIDSKARAPARAWLEPMLTALFAAAAVLLVSALAVVMGML